MNMKKALLVIDVQQGLCEGEGKAYQSSEVIHRINLVSAKARESGIPVIFIQHEGKSGYLSYGSREWQLANGLMTEPQDLKVRKTTPDSFLGTNLQELLNSLEVQELVICGMHSEYCVDTTTRRALALGYPVILLEDAHTSAGNSVISATQVIAHHNMTLTSISSFGPKARTIKSTEIKFEHAQ